ncbi:alpha/beta hydrolase [Streptomyces huiliensis]|uniref:alpha/beta hydrolase n=1 Tax=Streptomyces huiliensis TaxID=2876027 RepID=UPI001CBE5F79|nr:alpha/beta hydrolase [Streptomyces huiliensis]MBZ4323137.1 alpha/beta hydrolase family protein [Streptomyces huiliensis]
MVTIDELTRLDTSKFSTAAKSWGEISRKASAARQRVDYEMVAALSKREKGEAASAALSDLRQLSQNYQYIHTECGLVRTALDGLAADLAEPQRKLQQALDHAEQLKFTVRSNGSVEFPRVSFDQLPAPALQQPAHPDSAPPLTAATDPNAAKAQEIADRIASALREAGEIDRRYAEELGKLRTNGNLKNTDWADVARDLKSLQAVRGDSAKELAERKGKPPRENARWWGEKSKEEQERLASLFPGEIGNLDGIPAETRDRANRDYLPMLMDKLREDGSDDAETKLAGLRGLSEKLTARNDPPLLLLGVGDEGHGRAILSYGNPDTSKNVSAYVPGLGTRLDADFADGTVARAQQTASTARRYNASTASVVWLGYDAPITGTDQGWNNLDVMGEGRAKKGAPTYDRFLESIRATNGNEHPHVTAIGHSYGSLTVGKASQEPSGIPADDIIILGSPGVGVDKAEDLGVGKEHVFVGAADNDPVSWAPSKRDTILGTGGVLMGGALGGYVATELFGDDKNWFGTDPASKEFGAQRFKVNDGPAPLIHGDFMPAHSRYFDPSRDPESAKNIGLIVSGHSKEITRMAPR